MKGIAITGADTTNGAWQYSTNDGTTWYALDAVTGANARLLAATSTTKIRFVATSGYAGTVDPSITFRAWDTTSGSNGGLTTTSPNGGTAAFSTATDTASIVVNKRAVTVSVSCSPASVVAAQGTSCTAVVTDNETRGNPQDPAGTVTFTNTSGIGTFSAGSCTLNADGPGATYKSSCAVTYTPTNAATTAHVVKATYNGSAIYQGGYASTTVTVGLRTTQSGVTCANPVALGAAVTCTITVTDVDPGGTKSNPGGTATFSTDSATGSFTPATKQCSLLAITGSTTSSKCTISYQSSTVGVDNIHATYNGTSVHRTSSSQTAGSSGGLAVTYDPNAGFVTGGGTITSPAGAYPADPTLSGQANFGFVSKYQKGQSTPTGQTEFQFQTAKFNFHSELYDWLVVAGTKAQYKGTGTVNGADGYSFMITAVDGSPDKFRMKVWNTVSSAIVYDNKLGGTDTFADAPTQDISGGSIVIHAK